MKSKKQNNLYYFHWQSELLYYKSTCCNKSTTCYNNFHGKSTENVRGHTDMKFCLTKQQFKTCMSSPSVAGPPNVIKEYG